LQTTRASSISKKEKIMNGINKVIIVGTLGADPKNLTTRDGKPYAALSLATNRYWRSKEGTNERRTDWHRVNVWGKKALLCQERLKKGETVCVEGFLSSYEIEEEGQKRWQTGISADEVHFLSRRSGDMTSRDMHVASPDNRDESTH
jgi:single-strand DNA-binding protein